MHIVVNLDAVEIHLSVGKTRVILSGSFFIYSMLRECIVCALCDISKAKIVPNLRVNALSFKVEEFSPRVL